MEHGALGRGIIDVLGGEDLGLSQLAQQRERRLVDPFDADKHAQAQRSRPRERAHQLEHVDLGAHEGAVEGARVDRHP